MAWRRYFRRKRRDEDLACEIESYIAHEIDDNLARGMSAADARDAARRKFGNATTVREAVYHMNTLALIEAAGQDLRHGLRQLRLNPGFAVAAILSLALGIGANTAIFTLTDQIVLRLLSVENPRELVQLKAEGARLGMQSGDGRHTFSYPMYLAFRDRNTVFSGLTGQYLETASLVGSDRSEMVRVGVVAGNFFQVFGVRSHLGRLLTPDDDRVRDGHAVAVLQYDFWRTRYSGSPEIVGATIRINGTPLRVIGVAAPRFEGTDPGVPTHVWLPVMMKKTITPTWDALDDERYAWFYLFGRLRPGVTAAQAESAMKVLFRQRQQEELKGPYFQKFPQDRESFLRQSFSLVPASGGQSALRRRFERPLVVLEWLVGLVLLIACANVANLLLARAAAREREVAIRGALGAGRGHIVRQLLVESLILATAGGAVGLLLSSWMARGLVRFLPYDPANLSLSASPDLRVLLFTAAVTAGTVLLFGLLPAVRGSRIAPGTTLKQEAGSIAGGAHVRLRKVFVGLQVGLACLLLIAAGLFVRTLDNLRNIQLGFRTENVVMFRVRPALNYSDDRKPQVYRSLVEGLAATSGVKAAGAARTGILTGGRWDSRITIPGVTPKEGDRVWSYFNAVTPGYFEALGIPVKAGHDFTWRDWGSGRKRCLVNEALVREYLEGTNPLGRTLAQGQDVPPDTEIVGVFADARYDDVRGEVPRQVFLALDTVLHRVTGVTVYARIDGDPRQVMPELRAQVRRVDPNLVVSDMRMLDDQLNMRLSNERMLSFLSAAFAGLATLLAVVGLYGVLAFVVARRRHEIGIRVALGAKRGRVIRLVMREMLPAIAAGIAAGTIAGRLSGQYVESQLFGVKAADPLVFALGAGVLLAASVTAALIPAWRASRIDPNRALRYE